jgi:hypothetical protein
MNPRRSATMTAVWCGICGVGFAGFGSAGIENTAAPTLDRLAPFITADFGLTDAPQPTAMGNAGVGNVDVARAAELVSATLTDGTAASNEPKSLLKAALTNSSEMMPPETPPARVAKASTPSAMKETRDAVSSIKILGECLATEICIDRYLRALYQRTPETGREDGIKLHEPTKDYYFDSVAGNDGNNCLARATACASVAKMAALPYNGGDTINWKANSNFVGCLALSAERVRYTSGSSPLTIQPYGTGAAPIITSNCGGANSGGNGPKTAAITLDSISATVNGIAVRGSGLVSGSATQYGIAAQNSSGVGTPTFVIENVDIEGFGAPGATGDAGDEIFVSGFAEAAGFPHACGNIAVTILNTTLHGASTSAEDDTGFAGSGCNPGGFLTSEMVQGNLIYNIGGHGDAGGSGGYLSSSENTNYIQFTLAHDNGGNSTSCGGPAGLWAINSTGGIFQFNEVYNEQNVNGNPGGGACDWGGYDWDIGTANGVGQYLYSHNNAGPGFLMFNTSGSNTFRYSVSENDNFYVTDAGGVASMSGGGTSWAIYNITIYLTGSTTGISPAACASFGYSGTYTGGLWANNVCANSFTDMYSRTFMLQGNNAARGETAIHMVNNDYYNLGRGSLVFAAGWDGVQYETLALFQAGTIQEANTVQINPGFSAPPSGACSWTPSSASSWPRSGCPSAYSTIAAGLKSVGANLASTQSAYFTAPYPTTVGTRDYYGNTIPGTGSCFDMGAYGVCP